ncbi:MAG: 16S rRNA (guanine(966)-N(2))-methyltransferase RsmD [Clostridiales bacterium]|nr:16S rRNA (guanine(966)-N(2))-methyltransferase RsmD [Clostridiales bacterium]
MRVIAGTARRIVLNTPKGKQTRPTTDRIKETLFNILQPELYDAVFLDLFSGSGAIAIEALSRGAKKAVLAEQDKEALACIRDNLSRTHLSERAVVMQRDVFSCLSDLERGKETFDIVFMDPPYREKMEQRVLSVLKDASFICEDTMIVFEASIDTPVMEEDFPGFIIDRIKEYKTNKHVFLHRGH